VYPGGTALAQQFWGPAVSAQFPLGYFVEDYEYVTGSGDLDAFNGRTAVTPEYPNGTYAYWVTIDQNGAPAYPYTIGPWFYGMSDPVNMNGGATVPAGAVTWEPTVQITGAGCPTVAGGGFTVGTNGEATLPNPTFGLDISNGPAGGQAWLYLASGIAVSPLSLGGGCNVWLDMASASILVGTGQSPFGPFGLDGAGGATLPLPLPAPPALVGQQIDLQGLGADLTNPTAIITSNALTLRFL